MASIDKTSVRNEVSRLKADFEKLCADGKTSNEIKVIMNSMFMIIELMLSIFLDYWGQVLNRAKYLIYTQFYGKVAESKI